MSEASSAHGVVARALLQLVEETRATRARVLAAEHLPNGARDEEAVHDFRVSLRRLRTLLRVARRLFGKKQLARIEAELKHYAQATGALRDEEVLRETLASLPLPEAARAEVGAWLVRRSRAARPRAIKVAELLREGPRSFVSAHKHTKAIRPLDRVLSSLDARLRSEGVTHVGTLHLGHESIREAIRDVAEHARCAASDSVAMHDLRIREKRLRYTAELFAPVLGERVAHVAKHAARMQRRLGELHDLDAAIASVQRGRGLDEVTRGAALAALASARKACEDKLALHLQEERAMSLEPWNDDDSSDASSSDSCP